MKTTTETAEVLNDLIQINNDRIEGYEKARQELKDEDADLKTLFLNMIGESQKYKMALATEVSALGEDIETGTLEGLRFGVTKQFLGDSLYKLAVEKIVANGGVVVEYSV